MLNLTRYNLQLAGAGLLIGIGLGALFVFGVFRQDSVNWGRSDKQGAAPVLPEVGSAAPKFELNNLSGETVNFDHLVGQPLVINFWATWCGPCRLEMPLLQEYHQKFGSDLTIIAVNTGETSEDVQAYVDELELDLPILLDEQKKVEEMYRVRGLPSTYFVSEDGIIRFVHIGILTESQLQGYLDEIGVIE